MALGSSYARSLAEKASPPSEMEALGMSPDDEMAEGEAPDEDADAAVSLSAFEDFARAAGFKSSPKAYAAFKEAVHACMKG